MQVTQSGCGITTYSESYCAGAGKFEVYAAGGMTVGLGGGGREGAGASGCAPGTLWALRGT